MMDGEGCMTREEFDAFYRAAKRRWQWISLQGACDVYGLSDLLLFNVYDPEEDYKI